MNCTICDHPLIDHGYGENDACDCCAGRVWKNDSNPRELVVTKGQSDPGLPKGFKHIASRKFCFLVRINTQGEALIHLRKDGKTHVKSVQKLRSKAFGGD